MRIPRLSRRAIRRLVIAGGSVGILVVAVAIGMLVVYPRVGASKVREKLTSGLGQRLGRDVHVGGVTVRYGHATITNVDIRGPHDGDTPLVHIDRIDVPFDGRASLTGNVVLGDATVDGVVITLRRDATGTDNLRDIVDRLRAPAASGATGGGRSPRPTSVRVTRVKLFADDAVTSTTAIIGDGEATWRPGELRATGRDVTATTISAPKAGAKQLEIVKRTGEPPVIAIAGGELAIWPRLALSGISGTVAAAKGSTEQFVIDLAGGYGGVPGNLWTAKGALDVRALTASIHLEAAKFQLERLAPILAKTPVVDYANTSIDTKLHIEAHPGGAKFDGEMHLRGLNVGHPMIAEQEVHDLDLSAKVAGTYDRQKRELVLSRGDFVALEVPFSLTGEVAAPRTLEIAGDMATRRGPGGVQLLRARLVIPPIDCQRVLDAIPKAMAPYMAGYKLRGVFDTDIKLDIDWAALDATKLLGHVGIKHCKVVDQPSDSPKRLKEEFEHYVEVEQGQWVSFIVGPNNEDFVPLEEISPYLIKSIMSTEDSAFYHHRGFIVSEFRTALVNDLKAGRFKYGASSITMQMVKNVLLYREKTLARKLQELFLTWHVENTLSKDRILEIYFNVIEYGPALYGIRPATRHFFGKEPKDLNAVEAAFFSTILPSPKERYKQYCNNTLTRWTTDKIHRILGIMLKRERLTQEEYDAAMLTPLLFVKDGSETEDECLKRTKKVIKNARSTNPKKKS